MTRQRLTATRDSAATPTRRSFLAGLTAVGITGIRTATGRPSPATTASPTTQRREDPFTDPDALEAFVDEVMAERIGETTPGATIAIVSGDTPVLTKGYGEADVDAGDPVRADKTVFRVGSVGKLATYTAVMQGVERGVLDLDANVNTYLDDSAVTVPDTHADPVTLRHLGTHTAGFESTLDPNIVADPAGLDSLETVLVEQQRARIRPPGELVAYSNYGAALAGHIVAEAHDTSFEAYVQSELFDPLAMTHSTFAQPVRTDHPGNLAAPHVSDNGSFTVADDVYINMRPAGSLSATATDMARFMSAYLGNGAVGDSRILDTATVDTMHRRHHVRHPAVTNWRYGFHEHGSPDANLMAHSGATVNFTSYLLLAPDHDVGIFVAYNSNPSDPPQTVVDEIVDEYDLHASSPTLTPTTESGGRNRAATVAGEYSLSSLPQSGPLQVVDLLQHVTVQPTGAGRLETTTLEGDTREWVETDPYVYRAVDGYDVLAFEVTDGDGPVLHMSSTPTGVYLPVPVQERQRVTAGVLGTTLSGFSLSIAGWGGYTAWRHWQQYRADNEATEDSQ